MNEFNEFKEIFMVVGVAIRSIHTVGLAVHLADLSAIRRGPSGHPPEPTTRRTGRPLVAESAVSIDPSFTLRTRAWTRPNVFRT
jgi:hypothetical protein